MDAPAPVENPRAVFDQIHRGRHIGGDAGVRVALDDHLEARAGAVQGGEKALVSGVAGVGGEDAGHAAAVVVRLVGVAGIEAGALLARIAGLEVFGEVRGVEVHRAFDDADAYRRAVGGALVIRDALAVIVDSIEKAVGRPFAILPARPFLFVLFVAFRGGFLDHHGIYADLAAKAQHHGIALGQVFHRQAQLVGIERRDGSDHLGAVLFGQLTGLLQTFVVFLDDQADQIDIGGEVIHVARHLVWLGGEYLAATCREPDRIAALAVVLEPQRAAADLVGGQGQTQLIAVAADLLGGQRLAAQLQVHVGTGQAAGIQAPAQRVLGEQIAAPRELGDAQFLTGSHRAGGHGPEHGEAEGERSR